MTLEKYKKTAKMEKWRRRTRAAELKSEKERESGSD